MSAAVVHRRLVLVVLAVLSFAFLGTGGAAADNPTTTTTLAITANGVAVTTVPEGTELTFTATVTGIGAVPTGAVVFVLQDSGLALGDAATLTPSGPLTATAVFHVTLLPSATAYSIRAEYNPDLAALGSGLTPSVSTYQSITVSRTSRHSTHLTLTASPDAPIAGGTMTFTAAVASNDGGPTPTGAVEFSSTVGGSTSHIGTASLVDGVATISVDGWAAGEYTIEASYPGDASNRGSGAEIVVTVASGGTLEVRTDTTVTVHPATIYADETVTITAHVVQAGTHTPPPGGGPTDVEFRGNGTQLGTAGLDANGNATIVVDGWLNEDRTYDIKASYVGNIFEHIGPSSGDATLIVKHVPHPTSLHYNGDTTAATGATVHLSATLTDQTTGGALTDEPVLLALGGASCTATTNGVGRAECTVTTYDSAGTEQVTATFAGDDTYGSSSDSAPFIVTAPVPRLATQLSYTGDTGVLAGAGATLAFTLTTNGTPLSGRPVTLTFLGTPYPVTTDAAGVARLAVTAPTVPGPYPVTATYAGDASYTPAAGSGRLVVLTPATLTYSGATSAPGGASTTIAFTLTDAITGLPVAGRTITFTFDGATYTAVSGSDGRAARTVQAPLVAQSYSVGGAFAGDELYAPTTAMGTLTVTTIPTTLSYTGATTVTSGATATLSARLLDAAGHPLDGEAVTLQLASGESCAAVTHAGVASCNVRVDAPAGPDGVQAHFAGDPPYLASDASGTLTVTLADSKLALASVGPILSGSSVALSATLTSVQTDLALTGKPVTLTIGGQSCSGTTDALGVARCTIASVTAPAGLAPTSAAFAGDRFAKPSSATGTALVYALAPGGGLFVVGDRTATGRVTFWGAQWAKLNGLSGGSAPDAFKGFAAATEPAQCGGRWTTRPGNSTPPPNGPLPAYLAVVVSSTIGKSGSTIGGDTKRIVVVKTDNGYASDPGHAGTGTVVATVCG